MLNLIAKDFKLMFSGHGGAKKKLLSMVTALLMAAFVMTGLARGATSNCCKA